jgi:hypothetical protein
MHLVPLLRLGISVVILATELLTLLPSHLISAINTNGSIQGSPTYNYSGVTSSANISLTYDYTPASPVPEPSTYGLALGSLALVAGVVARRRKLKS